MADYLSAPVPFVMGLDSRFFDQYDQPNDVNAVDLDTNSITLCSSVSQQQINIKMLPKRPTKNLKNSLSMLQEKCFQHNKLAQRLEMENDDSIDFEFKLRARENALELEIQEAFLVFMASILGGYRPNLLPITRAPTAEATDVDKLFDVNGFLRSRDRNHHHFYKLVMKTQMFTKFIEECSFVSDINTSLAFFDECVLQLEREEGGRLLESDGSVSDRTVFILPPDASGQRIMYTGLLSGYVAFVGSRQCCNVTFPLILLKFETLLVKNQFAFVTETSPHSYIYLHNIRSTRGSRVQDCHT